MLTRADGAAMKITLLAPFAMHPKGTTRVRVMPLARALARRGHAVTVLIPPYDHPQDSGDQWEDQGVRVRNLPVGSNPGNASLALLGLALARAARRTTPDVIHVFKPKGVTGIAQLALWALRQQRVVLDIDDWEGRGGWNERRQYSALSRHMFAWQEQWGIRHASALTAASQTLIGQARNLDVPAQRLSYVPNGVDETLYAQWRDADGGRIRAHYGLADRPVVLLYSRFFEFGVERAAAIFTRVAHAVPQSMLLVVGSGPHGEEQDLAASLARAGLGDRVVLAGWQEPAALPAHVAAADVALYPLDDTLLNRAKCPAKLVELMAAGRPVVAESVGEAARYITIKRRAYSSSPVTQMPLRQPSPACSATPPAPNYSAPPRKTTSGRATTGTSWHKRQKKLTPPQCGSRLSFATLGPYFRSQLRNCARRI